MKIKPNYFNNREGVVSQIKKEDGSNYSVRQDRMRYFFPDEWIVFHDALETPRQRLTFNFLVNTGARINEIRNVRVCDIDFDRKSMILRITKTRNADGSHKIRVIPISSQFSKYLRKIIEEYKLKNEDLFPLLSCAGANISLKDILKKIEIQDWKNFSVHNLRKTLEVWLLSLNVDSLKIIKHFGHTIDVASKHYVSSETFNFDDKRLIRDIIGDLYYDTGGGRF